MLNAYGFYITSKSRSESTPTAIIILMAPEDVPLGLGRLIGNPRENIAKVRLKYTEADSLQYIQQRFECISEITSLM